MDRFDNGFTIEVEVHGRLPFLDIHIMLVHKPDGSLDHSVCRSLLIRIYIFMPRVITTCSKELSLGGADPLGFCYF